MRVGDIRTKNYELYILPNTSDGFEQLSITNGLYNVNGGNNIQFILDKVIPPIRQKLQKKYKSIKPADIRNKLKVVCLMRFFPNPEYNSQTKDFLANSQAEIAEFLADVNWDKVVQTLLRDKELIGNITDYFKIKEEFREKQELKKAKSTKKTRIVDSKFLGSIGAKKNLFLCEGDSAQSSLANILGRKGNAFVAMAGVPMNVWEEKVTKIANSKKFELMASLLDVDYVEKTANPEYDNIIIATDADLPGTHIKGLLLAYFYRFSRNLLEDGRIKLLKTPLVFAYKGNKIVKYFFNFKDFKEYEREHPELTYKYTKGLGRLDKKYMKKLFETKGIEHFLETLEVDEDTEKSLDVWFKKANADMRKKLIKETPFNINNL